MSIAAASCALSAANSALCSSSLLGRSRWHRGSSFGAEPEDGPRVYQTLTEEEKRDIIRIWMLKRKCEEQQRIKEENRKKALKHRNSKQKKGKSIWSALAQFLSLS